LSWPVRCWRRWSVGAISRSGKQQQSVFRPPVHENTAPFKITSR
jgi:hypothetical protein